MSLLSVRLDQDHPVRPDEFIAEGLGAVQQHNLAPGRGDDRIDVEVGGRTRIRPHPPTKPLQDYPA